MTKEELEAALISNGIARDAAKLIVRMAFSPKIEYLPDGCMLPVVEVIGSVLSKQVHLKVSEAMRPVMKASISLEEAGRIMSFSVLRFVRGSRESQFIMYSFSPQFIAWAGLSQGMPCAVN